MHWKWTVMDWNESYLLNTIFYLCIDYINMNGQNISNSNYIDLQGLLPQNTRLGGLATEINFSKFWDLKVQDQGVGIFNFLWGFSPGLADGHSLAVSTHGLSSLWDVLDVSLCFQIYFSKTTSQIGLRPTLKASF